MHKVLAVPADKLSVWHRKVKELEGLPPLLLEQIFQFFEHCKDLEANKWVKMEGWVGSADSLPEIVASVERFNAAPDKSCV